MSKTDDLLEEEFNRYLKEVTESGLPLWVAHMYGYPYPCHEPTNQSEEEDDDNQPLFLKNE